MRKFRCRHCGEEFTASKETLELLEEGYITIPEECDDCLDLSGNSGEEIYTFSDADPGL